MTDTHCVLKKPRCGLQSGNPVCAKCGLDTHVGGYTSQQAGEEARSKALAAWQTADDKEQAELLELEQHKAQEAKHQAEKERSENSERKVAEESAQRLTQEKAEAGVQANRSEWQGILLTLVLVGVVCCFVVWDRLSRKEEFVPVQASAPAAAPAALPDCRDAYCPEMVVLPAGNFQMGSNDSEADSHEKPVHSVSIKSFSIGKYEVTQGQWRAIMGSNPSRFTECGDNCPVDSVTWGDVRAFIQKLNQKTGLKYRLPSEAEWEYACRGGQQQKYCGSDNVGDAAWYEGNTANNTHPVGQKAPNRYGLYDMSGNVWEWVQDGYHDSYNGAPSDGSSWTTSGVSGERVLRGGSWYYVARNSRAASRGNSSSVNRMSNLGFRLARTVP